MREAAVMSVLGIYCCNMSFKQRNKGKSLCLLYSRRAIGDRWSLAAQGTEVNAASRVVKFLLQPL